MAAVDGSLEAFIVCARWNEQIDRSTIVVRETISHFCVQEQEKRKRDTREEFYIIIPPYL